MNARSVGREDTPAEYEIRVKGHLDSRWAAWFEGLSVTNEHDGTAVIRTRTVDQAALHGLLQKLRDLALPLLAITQTGTTQTSRPASNARIFIPKKDHTMKTTTQTRQLIVAEWTPAEDRDGRRHPVHRDVRQLDPGAFPDFSRPERSALHHGPGCRLDRHLWLLPRSRQRGFRGGHRRRAVSCGQTAERGHCAGLRHRPDV